MVILITNTLIGNNTNNHNILSSLNFKREHKNNNYEIFDLARNLLSIMMVIYREMFLQWKSIDLIIMQMYEKFDF